jgi:adenosylhomocysteinase
MKYDVADLSLASQGKKRILWADNDMPVLAAIRNDFSRTKPLKGQNVSACLHITAETANLARTLKAAGANVVLCASNPLSTQDDVAASLVKEFRIPVFAVRGENRTTYYKHINAAIDHKPVITFDDGADLVNELHTRKKNDSHRIIASMEETTTGVIRLRAMANAGLLRFPVIAVNDAATKHLFDNRYGTGQSTGPLIFSWPAKRLLWPAMAGVAGASPCEQEEWELSLSLRKLTPSRPWRPLWMVSR